MNLLKHRCCCGGTLLILGIAFTLGLALMATHEILAQPGPVPPPPPPQPKPTVGAAVMGVAGGGVVVLVMVAYGIYRLRKRRRGSATSRTSSI